MPFRLEGYEQLRAKIQFVTAASMPHRIYKACLKTNTVSNTVYIQHAVCEALARDLDIPLQELLDELPTPRGIAARVVERNGKKVCVPSRTNEEIL